MSAYECSCAAHRGDHARRGVAGAGRRNRSGVDHRPWATPRLTPFRRYGPHAATRSRQSLHADTARDRGERALAGAGQPQAAAGQTCPASATPTARRRVPRATPEEKSPMHPLKYLTEIRHLYYTCPQCQPRSTSPAFPPNPPKGLVRASSAGSAARCAAPLSAASPSPVPCGGPHRHMIREPPPPGECVFCAGRAPLSLPRCSRRPCSRVCSPPAVTVAPQPPPARHFSTGPTRPSPRRHIPNSAPKPARFSIRRARTAIPRLWSWWFPRSPSTSIRSCRPKRASRFLRERFPTCGTASAPR
jgi:hypothetical protein